MVRSLGGKQGGADPSSATHLLCGLGQLSLSFLLYKTIITELMPKLCCENYRRDTCTVPKKS